MFPSLCCGDRKWVRIVLAVLVFSVFATLASAQTDNWVGTSGKWSDAAQWDSGVPVAGDNIVIGTASANSMDDFGLAIGSLTLSNAADTLNISDGVALNVSGPISNAGAIQLNSGGPIPFCRLRATSPPRERAASRWPRPGRISSRAPRERVLKS